MDITMALPTITPHGRKEALAWYRKIDEGPWHGLATFDRLACPHGWSLVPELAAAAAMTERVRLWTAVAVPALRDAVLFAKDIATIDVLSEGRVTLGVGIGAYDEDYLAVGREVHLKHQRMDSQIAAMRETWSQKPPVDGYSAVGPRPLQPGGVPLVAGVHGPKAIARAARWASGVMDGHSSLVFDPEDLNAQRALVFQAWKDAGRTELPQFSACVFFAVGPNAREHYLKQASEFVGPEHGEEIRSAIARSPNPGADGLRNIFSGARAVGLDNLILAPLTADPAEIDRARDALGI
jgi:alkanesulfonate monooxygenase SsuD/methylene tetrahydromethanopterin reductase-like flavin-dependent oxidoreductase (luciferase family)